MQGHTEQKTLQKMQETISKEIFEGNWFHAISTPSVWRYILLDDVFYMDFAVEYSNGTLRSPNYKTYFKIKMCFVIGDLKTSLKIP